MHIQVLTEKQYVLQILRNYYGFVQSLVFVAFVSLSNHE